MFIVASYITQPRTKDLANVQLCSTRLCHTVKHPFTNLLKPLLVCIALAFFYSSTIHPVGQVHNSTPQPRTSISASGLPLRLLFELLSIVICEETRLWGH